jgi:hypothetical protein
MRLRQHWLLLAVSTAAMAILAAVTALGAASGQNAQGKTAAKKHASAAVKCGKKGPAFTGRATAARTVVCRGPRGLRGKRGPRGPAGPPGASAPTVTSAPAETRVVIHRTVIPRTSNAQVDGGNIRNLAVVGGVHIDGLCRVTNSNGAGGFNPNNGNDVNLWKADDPNFAPGGESEAKIIVWSETGTMSFKGDAGPRTNVPAGGPSFDSGTPSDHEPAGEQQNASATNGEGGAGKGPDPVQGEGEHMFAHSSNENGDENRPLDGTLPAFGYGAGWVATSGGTDLVLNAFAGLDVLGVGGNNCVFAGLVDRVS